MLLASLLVVLGIVVGGTLAWLTDDTGIVTNTFFAGEVPNEVIEDLQGNVKNDVKIKNTGNVDAYIRAAVTVTWVEVDENGNLTGNVYGEAPVLGEDYEWYPADDSSALGTIGENWKKGKDGYYYYTHKVPENTETGILFTRCKPIIDSETGKTKNQPEGYVLSVEIMGQSIQADGKNSEGIAPVIVEWGTANGGSVKAVGSDGTLTVESN